MTKYSDMADKSMAKCVQVLKDNFSKVRTGRANPHILDDIKVDYYGVPTPIIEPWDKSSLRSIEKAIEQSDLGITPSNDGISIRLPFPRPTEERRKELAKECAKLAEEAKVSIRNVRRDVNGKIERDEEVTEDVETREKKAVQKVTDSYTKKVDELLKNKTAEVMEI